MRASRFSFLAALRSWLLKPVQQSSGTNATTRTDAVEAKEYHGAHARPNRPARRTTRRVLGLPRDLRKPRLPPRDKYETDLGVAAGRRHVLDRRSKVVEGDVVPGLRPEPPKRLRQQSCPQRNHRHLHGHGT